MTTRSLWRRLTETSPARARLIAEAAAALASAWLRIRLHSFRGTIAFGQPARGGAASADPVEIASAVRSAAAKLPWRLVCFPQGLAAQRMLRRRGYDARLHYGIGKSEEDRLQAHVWVSLDGRTLIGGEEAPRFREVASYP